VHLECGFPSIFGDNLDVVITLPYIKFAEEDLVSESFDCLTNIWEWCDVFDRVLVQFTEVLYNALRAIFLRDRKGG
jgi:hypothetical protein